MFGTASRIYHCCPRVDTITAAISTLTVKDYSYSHQKPASATAQWRVWQSETEKRTSARLLHSRPLTGLALHNTPKRVRNVGMTGVGCYDVYEGSVMTLHSDLSCTWDPSTYILIVYFLPYGVRGIVKYYSKGSQREPDKGSRSDRVGSTGTSRNARI